jgi:hypothetical protein
MNKSQYKRAPSCATFKEQVALSGGWLNSKYTEDKAKNIRYETAKQFYQNTGSGKAKQSKTPVGLGRPKNHQLEDEKWTDKVFTGDSHKNVAALTFHAR